MAEETTQQTTEAKSADSTENTAEKKSTDTGLKLSGLIAFKEGMATVYNEKGEALAVTVLRYEPLIVTQIKTKESDGYEAVQVGVSRTRDLKDPKATKKHFEKAGLTKGAKVAREIRQKLPAGVQVGQSVSIDSFVVGDVVHVSGTSKGHGFAGVVKRWKFEGGRASHGRGFLRQPGSVGNRTEPGRVMPGKRFPGHWGDERVTAKNVKVVDVMSDKNLLLVMGPVPGARNGLVMLEKVK